MEGIHKLVLSKKFLEIGMQISRQFVLPITLPRDLALIADAISGNVRYALRLYRLNASNEDDVLQSTLVLIAALEPPRIFPTQRHCYSYVTSCAMTAARNLWNQTRRAKELEYDVEDYRAKLPPDDIGRLSDAVETLPEELKAIVKMKYDQRMNNTRIANELGISDKTVARRLESARSELFRRIINE